MSRLDIAEIVGSGADSRWLKSLMGMRARLRREQLELTQDAVADLLREDGGRKPNKSTVSNLEKGLGLTKEPMRRDASVCLRCQRESIPWTFRDGRWWTRNNEGAEVWFDERLRVWVKPAQR